MDPDKARNDGATPMFAAAQNGHADALQLLLQAKADPDKAKDNGVTPMFAAAHSGHADALQLLLQAKADPDKARDDGATPKTNADGTPMLGPRYEPPELMWLLPEPVLGPPPMVPGPDVPRLNADGSPLFGPLLEADGVTPQRSPVDGSPLFGPLTAPGAMVPRQPPRDAHGKRVPAPCAPSGRLGASARPNDASVRPNVRAHVGARLSWRRLTRVRSVSVRSAMRCASSKKCSAPAHPPAMITMTSMTPRRTEVDAAARRTEAEAASRRTEAEVAAAEQVRRNHPAAEMYKLMIRCLEGILAVEHFLQSAAWAQFFFVGHLASGEYWEIPELKADNFELVPGVQRSCMDLQVIYESYAKAFAELSVRCVNGINRVAPHLHLRITARFNTTETDRVTAGTFAAYKNSITAIMERSVPEAGVLDDEIVETLNMAKTEDLKRKTIMDEHTLVPTYVVPRFTKKSCTRIHITM